VHVVPWYDQNLRCFHISGIFPKTAWRHWRSARRCMNYVLFYRFLWWTTWRQGWLHQATQTLCKIVISHTFCTTGIAGHWFYTAINQALDFWALGATNFSSLRSFRKTGVSDSLTVQFRWNFDRRFITCYYSLWTVKICIGCLID